MRTTQNLLMLAACAGLLGTAQAQFDEIQNYGDGRTDGGGPGFWEPLAPAGATITAGGGDFWGETDNASFLTSSDGSLTTTGDFTATARHVNTVDPSTNEWGREPLMMRAQAATGSPMDPANPENTNADAAHYMAYRRSASDVDTGWRVEPAGDTDDWARTGGPGFIPTRPIATSAHYLAIGRNGGDLYAGHAADISFGDDPPTPGRWLQLHSTNDPGSPEFEIGAGTEVTVGIGHQAHNAIPGGSEGANVTNWDNFNFNDGTFEPGKFLTPLDDYSVVATLGIRSYVAHCGDITGQAFTLEGGESTEGPTGWRIVAQQFVNVPLFGVANSVLETTAAAPEDLVPAANLRISEGNPGLNADIYLGEHPGDLAAIRAVIDGSPPNGTTVIPDVWWADEDVIGYPDSTPGPGFNDGPNLFSEAVPGSFDLGAQDNYGVHMTGEIQIPASAVEQGFIAFKDGVDDFAYLSIDGVDLINDNSWTGVETSQNEGGTISLLDTSGYTAGQWVSFEMITWQNNASESAALFWDIGGTSSLNREAYPLIEEEGATITSTGTSPIGDHTGPGVFPNFEIPNGIWDITLTVINTERMETVTARSVPIECEPVVVDIPPKTFVVAEPGALSAVVTWEEPSVAPPETIEQTGGPPNGSMFPLGATEVEYTVTDAAGAETKMSFLVAVSLNPNDTLAIVTTDDPAPGGIGNFSGFFGGYIAGPGQVVILGEDGSPAPRAEGLWRGDINTGDPLELLSLTGTALPGTESPLAGYHRYFIAKDGNVAFHGLTDDGGVGHWYDDGETLDSVAVLGGPALLGATFDLLPKAGQGLTDDGEYFFLARLARAAGIVTNRNNWGIWSNTDGDPLIRKGDPVPAIPGAVYLDFEPQIAATVGGNLVFSAAMRGGSVINGVDNRALYAGPSHNPVIIARKGSPEAGESGAIYHQFGRAAISKDGSVAFSSSLVGTGTTVDNNTAIYTNAGGTLVQVVRENEPAPGFELGEVFDSFDDIYLCGDSVWFKATVRPATATTNDGIYVWRPGEGLSLIASEGGETAPGTSGVFRSISKHTATHCCQSVFTGILQRGVGGVTRRNSDGVWHVPAGAVEARLMVRGGDTFVLGGNVETIQRPDILQTKDDGTGGRSSALGAANMVVLLSYDGGRKSGVFLIGLAGERR